MKRLFYIILFFITNYNVHADWDLFPLNQVSYYRYSDFRHPNKINSVSMDTMINRGTHLAMFFNRKYSGTSFSGYYHCIAGFDGPIPANGPYTDMEMDTLYERNDTVFFMDTIFFLPKAQIGQSWQLVNQTVTCDSLGVEQFFGITDSIKYFSRDTAVIALSKHHGFLSYIPFYRFIYSWPFAHELIGFSESSGDYGFVKPSYLDFFPYQPGDILIWKYGNEPSFGLPVHWWDRDSLLSVTYGIDTIRYTFNRVHITDSGVVSYYSNWERKYVVSDLINMLEAPTNWNFFQEANGTLMRSFSYELESDSSISYRSVNDGFQVPDSVSCNIMHTPDVAMYSTFNTSVGFVEWSYSAFYPNVIYDSLVGSVLGGIVRGDTALSVGVNETAAGAWLSIKPNPVVDVMVVEAGVRISGIRITDMLGRVVYEESANDYSRILDLSFLESSMYMITVNEVGGRGVTRKFLKQ